VGTRMIVASPPAALDQVLAVVNGSAPADVASDGWAQVEAASPQGRTAWSYRDGGADLRGVADLLDLAAQPAAAFMALGMRAALEEARSAPADEEGLDFGFEDDQQPLVELADADGYPGPDGVLDASARELTAGMPVDAEIGPDTPTFDFDLIDVWSLAVIPAGSEASVVMTSTPLDTYLYLYDAETGNVLAENDDAPWTDRSEIRFVSDGRPLLVGASTWGGGDGPYRLELILHDAEMAEPAPEPEAEPEPAVQVDAPSFAELLPLTEIVPAAVRIVADRTGPAWGVTYLLDGVIRTDQRQAFDW